MCIYYDELTGECCLGGECPFDGDDEVLCSDFIDDLWDDFWDDDWDEDWDDYFDDDF